MHERISDESLVRLRAGEKLTADQVVWVESKISEDPVGTYSRQSGDGKSLPWPYALYLRTCKMQSGGPVDCELVLVDMHKMEEHSDNSCAYASSEELDAMLADLNNNRKRGRTMRIKLGQKVHHIITGIRGIVVSRTEYLSGCAHVGIQQPIDKDGKVPDVQWRSEMMCEITDEATITPPKDPKDQSGPQSNPPDRS